jgi:outer membrane protein assembly factor BamB
VKTSLVRVGLAVAALIAVVAPRAGAVDAIARPNVKPSINVPSIIDRKPLRVAQPITVANVAQLQTAWTVSLYPAGVQNKTREFGYDEIDTGHIYLSWYDKQANGDTKAELRCYNLPDGSLLWSAPEVTPAGTQAQVFGTPLFCGSSNVVAAIGLRIKSFDTANGNQRWDQLLTKPVNYISQSYGGKCFLSSVGEISAVNFANGSTSWHVGAASSGPAMEAGGVLYVGTTGGLKALDPQTGSGKWTSTSDFSSAALPVDNSSMVFTCSATAVYGLKKSNGFYVWRTVLPDNLKTGGPYPLAIGDYVYVIAQDYGTPGNNRVLALDQATGTVQWDVSAPGASTLMRMPVVNGVLFVPAQKLTALDASSGVTLGSFQSPSMYGFRSVAVLNGSTVVGIAGGDLVAMQVW